MDILVTEFNNKDESLRRKTWVDIQGHSQNQVKEEWRKGKCHILGVGSSPPKEITRKGGWKIGSGQTVNHSDG